LIVNTNCGFQLQFQLTDCIHFNYKFQLQLLKHHCYIAIYMPCKKSTT